MKIAVTGAGGKLGVPLVQMALDAGHTVVAIDRQPLSQPPSARPLAI